MKLVVCTAVSCCSLLLLSCGKKEAEKDDASAKEQKVKKHAYEWEPKEAHLVAGKAIYVQECALCHDEGEERLC